MCFGSSLVLRAKAAGQNPMYYVLGETYAGRHLFCVVIEFPDGKGYPVTVRNMTNKGRRRRYADWKKRRLLGIRELTPFKSLPRFGRTTTSPTSRTNSRRCLSRCFIGPTSWPFR